MFLVSMSLVDKSLGFLLHKKSFGTSPDGRQNVVYFTGDTVFIENEFRKLREIPRRGCTHEPWLGNATKSEEHDWFRTDHDGR